MMNFRSILLQLAASVGLSLPLFSQTISDFNPNVRFARRFGHHRGQRVQ